MFYYQFNLLISSKLNQDEIGKIINRITSVLKEQGKLSLSKTNKINLAYPIKKEDSAIIFNFNFYPKEVKTNWLSEIKQELNSKKEVLRYVILKKKRVPKRVAKKRGDARKAVNMEDVDKKLEEILNKK